MPILNNTRQELFAQGVALGKTGTRAYIDAGYSETGADAGASRLLGKVKVSARVNELKAGAAKSTGLTIESLTIDLLRIAKKGEDLTEASGLSVARASLMDAAKLNGLVVDKGEGKMDVNMSVHVSYSGARPEGSAADYETP